MAERRLGSALRGIVYVGAALLLHGALFLIPWKAMTPTEPRAARGMRVRVFSAAPRGAPAAVPAPSPAARPSPDAVRNAVPGTETAPSATGAGSEAGGRPGGDGSGGLPGGAGAGGESATGMSPDAYSRYLARLRSNEVQGWARDSSRQGLKEWRGSGAGSAGWGSGAAGGSGSGRSPGGGPGGYLDPRVRMVVASYPSTSIETRHTAVPYPEIRFKKQEYASGWWNVYFQIWTDERGQIRKITKLRPETDGRLERLFVEQVRREIERWTFDPVAAEIIVDVRFHVE